MTEKLNALRELLAIVEKGDALDIAKEFHLATGGKEYYVEGPCALAAGRAYRGSLDAAKALHEAILPGFAYEVTSYGTAAVDGMGRYQGLAENDPARAWLICILRALIAQEEAQ